MSSGVSTLGVEILHKQEDSWEHKTDFSYCPGNVAFGISTSNPSWNLELKHQNGKWEMKLHLKSSKSLKRFDVCLPLASLVWFSFQPSFLTHNC